jgi:hypothetical protein
VTLTPVQAGPARTEADLDAVRDLMRAFVAWHRTRHDEDRQLVEAYFDDAAFGRELEDLAAFADRPRSADRQEEAGDLG